jgi:small GTP-binding protein
LDTAGEEDYQNMLDQWIESAGGFILLYAINDLESFQALQPKVERIKKNEAEKLPIVVVGNKVDLNNERKVSKQQAEEFANSIKAKYFETSALTDSNGNVKLVFETIGNLMIDKANGENNEDKKCSNCLVF